MALFLLNLLAISERIYVILGGSSASNTNQYLYEGNNSNVFSYYNGKWVIADSPMPGGDGTLGSFWPSVGNQLQKYYNEDIYFIDCAREDAIITDWSSRGKYYQLSQFCFSIGKNISNNYSVLWQEGPQDNIYSYNSNVFVNILTNLITSDQTWYLSIFTYPDNNSYRWAKINDISFILGNVANTYLGADIDSGCWDNITFNQEQNQDIADMWFSSITENNSPYFPENLYNSCQDYTFVNFILIFALLVSILFLCSGCFYCFRFYKRRREYINLNN